MFFTVYKGQEIISSGDNFKVKLANGEYLPEVAASIETAKKWIDGLPTIAAPVVLPVKVPFAGFYETSHNACFDSWLEYEQEVLESEHGATLEQLQELAEKFYSCIDWQAVHVDYAKEYCEQLVALIADVSRQYVTNDEGKRELSQPFKLQLEFEELKSPRFYNYETDCIYAKIPLEQLQALLDAIPAEKWREFVREQCTGYDGFISFYSPDFDEWEKDLSEWGEARLGMILEAYIMHILEDERESDIKDALSGFSLMQDYDGNGKLSNSLWQHATKEFTEYADSLRKE